jgi:ABC-type branched-subunit amino acid transport system substrate-binding protein
MGDLGTGPSTSAPPPPSPNIGTGKVKVGLILPLSATGNAAVAAQSMRNAAEMALAEFNNPDLQLLVKDDGGTAQGAQQVAQQVLDEGAEIILGPLFALTVGPVGRAARARNVPVIAFSTDANVAARGVYLLSFLPESDVERIIGYAASQGRRAWRRAPSSRRWRAVTGASSRSSAIPRTRRRCRRRSRPWRRRRWGRAGRTRSSFRTAPTVCRRWCRS